MNYLAVAIGSRRWSWVGLLLAVVVAVLAVGAGAGRGRAAAVATLDYGTYLGGSITDEGRAVAVDGQGNIYVVGQTMSENFLGYETPIGGYSDIFAAKFDPGGQNLLYLTVFGSSDSETPIGAGVDAAGNLYITAMTFGDDFPLINPLWPEFPHFSHDGTLTKLDPDGNGVYSTLLPLDVFDATANLAVDAAGNAYVTGTDFRDAVGNQIAVLKIAPNGQSLLLDEYLGGTDSEKAAAIDVDAAGNIYVAGRIENGDGQSFPVTANAHQPECGDMALSDNFYCFEDGVIMVLDATGQVTYSSYHGGSFTDEPAAIAADGKGRILIAGNTGSGVFPVVNPLQATCPIDSSSGDCRTPRGFVSLIELADGQATVAYSTYLGSTESDSVTSVAAADIDAAGQGTVVGYTNGLHFPLAAPIQDQLAESFCTTFGSERYCFDAFVTTFTPGGDVAFGTYLGGVFDEFPYGVTVDDDALYVTGLTEAGDFPVTANAFQPDNQIGDDGFLVRIRSGVIAPPPDDYHAYVPSILR